MKKVKYFSAILICLCCIALLFSCVQSDAAKEVDEKIAAIGEVSLHSIAAIEAVETAYSDLSEFEQFQVKGHKTLVDARNTYTTLRAERVISLIDDIGEITLESSWDIKAAEVAFEALTDDQQQLVSNSEKLFTARAEYSNMCISNVEHLINSIGEVTLENRAAIETAEAAYEQLTSSEKGNVLNYDILSAAKTRLDELEKEDRKNRLAAIMNRINAEEDSVAGVTWYTSVTHPEYINTRSYALPYIGKFNDGGLFMHIIYNYAGKKWIFFDKVTIAVDDKRYSRNFNYFDISHDYGRNSYLTENIDIFAQENDIRLLYDIANSQKTVVRFEGDHQYDLTVSTADKQAIADILELYNLLSQEDGIKGMENLLEEVKSFLSGL